MPHFNSGQKDPLIKRPSFHVKKPSKPGEFEKRQWRINPGRERGKFLSRRSGAKYHRTRRVPQNMKRGIATQPLEPAAFRMFVHDNGPGFKLSGLLHNFSRRMTFLDDDFRWAPVTEQFHPKAQSFPGFAPGFLQQPGPGDAAIFAHNIQRDDMQQHQTAAAFFGQLNGDGKGGFFSGGEIHRHKNSFRHRIHFTASKARLSFKTLTPGSPRKPRSAASVFC